MTTGLSDSDLVAGRECGACNICCVALTINSPDFKKLPGIQCTHYLAGVGCFIYNERPSVCRTYYCGWRRLDWLPEEMWPHKSGILVRRISDGLPSSDYNFGLVFDVLTSRDALDGHSVRSAIATSIISDTPTYLGVHGAPGYAGTRVYLNERLKAAVRNSDETAVKRGLRRAYFDICQAPKAKIDFTELNSERRLPAEP